MRQSAYHFHNSVLAATFASLFTIASAQAVITLTGDSRFLSAEFRLDRPDGGSSAGGPFTVTPGFGIDQFGSSPGPGVVRDGNSVFAGPNFQESSYRPERIVARGNFMATSDTLVGYTGMARVLNRVDYRFTLNPGDEWLIEGTSSGHGFFQLFDPMGNLVLANSGTQVGFSLPGTYRLLAGDNGFNNSTATSSGGSATFAGTYDVTFNIIPSPGTSAIAVFGLLTACSRRRRA